MWPAHAFGVFAQLHICCPGKRTKNIVHQEVLGNQDAKIIMMAITGREFQLDTGHIVLFYVIMVQKLITVVTGLDFHLKYSTHS